MTIELDSERERAARQFRKSVRRASRWADLLGLIAILAIAKGLKPVAPHPEENGLVNIDEVLSMNPWLAKHAGDTTPRAEETIDIETAYLDRVHEATPVGGTTSEKMQAIAAAVRRSAARMNMLRRNLLGQLRQDAQWRAVSDPTVRLQIPFAEYRSMHMPTTRPTHAAMSGFVARVESPLWKIVRPLNGFNCQCILLWHNRASAFRQGWQSADGTARFDHRWPNTGAQINFEQGRFPDAGWRGPKETMEAV